MMPNKACFFFAALACVTLTSELVAAEVSCSGELPCSEGIFCNFVYGDSGGHCEECPYTSRWCSNYGLPDPGTNDCLAVCPSKFCSGEFPCSEGLFCNFIDGDSGGFCEECPFATSDCSNPYYEWPTLGVDECEAVCPNDPPEQEFCSVDLPCSEGTFCNFDFGDSGGFCEECPFWTDHCPDLGLIDTLGVDDCEAVCPEREFCSVDLPCSEGTFCNFDFGDSGGFCQECPFWTDHCSELNLIDTLGVDDCEAVCPEREFCSDEFPCSASGAFCNFDWGDNGGFCQECPSTSRDCSELNLIDTLGVDECEAVCLSDAPPCSPTFSSICSSESFCPVGIPVGYYPDLTNKNAYCFCTGTKAPSRYERCNAGLVWDNFGTAWLGGKDSSGAAYGKGGTWYAGYWGTIGGGCGWAHSVHRKNRQRPPYTPAPNFHRDECGNFIMTTLVEVDVASDVPSTVPSDVPTKSPSKEPTDPPTSVALPDPPKGCCSSNFKTCNATWKKTKSACNGQGLIWLAKGAVGGNCKTRYKQCKKQNQCCPGLKCKGSRWYKSCNL